jgi:apolipoprotein D and lipocalin family protein
LALIALALLPRMALAQTVTQTPVPVRTVPFVDLNRYAGDWFEAARYPNWFQRNCLGDVRASYARRPDGRIDVVNRCRTTDGQIEARAIARIVDDRSFSKLKVRFAPDWLSWLPMVWGDYWILGVSADYSWAVVGDPDRNYLWILSRTPQLGAAAMTAARAVARANGYDVDRLVTTPQGSRDVPPIPALLGGTERTWPRRPGGLVTRIAASGRPWCARPFVPALPQDTCGERSAGPQLSKVSAVAPSRVSCSIPLIAT